MSIVIINCILTQTPVGRITFRAERGNVHDKNAVQVFDRNMRVVGYVCREMALLIRDEIKQNEWMEVTITKQFSSKLFELTVTRSMSIDEAFPGEFAPVR